MSASSVQKIIKDKEIEYVDLRFTDPRGKLQHVTMDATIVDEDMLNEGVSVSYTHLTLPTTSCG